MNIGLRNLLLKPRMSSCGPHGSLGVCILSAGYGEDEFYRAGAYRADQDPADLLAHLKRTGSPDTDLAWRDQPDLTAAGPPKLDRRR